MSDASLSVTQRRVELFAAAYLEAIGCSVRERGDELVVTVPEAATTEVLDAGTTTLARGTDRVGDALALHPESETFQALLREATDRAPIGRIDLTDGDAEIRLPEWLVESEVSVASARFTPYYSRTAVVGLFRIGIETVSEYQTAVLRAGAVDANSMSELPALADRLLARSTPGSPPVEAATPTLDADTAHEAIDALGELLVDRVRPTITEIREGATRAAGAELDEYRQLQEQRIDELNDEIAALSDRIERLRSDAESVESQAERLETLRDRKSLNAERDERRDELADLTDSRAAGFPEKRGEVRDRHGLEVAVEPLTLTECRYEQGELEVTVVESDGRHSLRVGYGNGVGVTESVACERCGSTLSNENPLRLDDESVCCVSCRR